MADLEFFNNRLIEQFGEFSHTNLHRVTDDKGVQYTLFFDMIDIRRCLGRPGVEIRIVFKDQLSNNYNAKKFIQVTRIDQEDAQAIALNIEYIYRGFLKRFPIAFTLP